MRGLSHHCRNQEGFTLVEVLIAAGLLAIVSIGVGQLIQYMGQGTKGARQVSDLVALENSISSILLNSKACTTNLVGANPAFFDINTTATTFPNTTPSVQLALTTLFPVPPTTFIQQALQITSFTLGPVTLLNAAAPPNVPARWLGTLTLQVSRFTPANMPQTQAMGAPNFAAINYTVNFSQAFPTASNPTPGFSCEGGGQSSGEAETICSTLQGVPVYIPGTTTFAACNFVKPYDFIADIPAVAPAGGTPGTDTTDQTLITDEVLDPNTNQPLVPSVKVLEEQRCPPGQVVVGFDISNITTPAVKFVCETYCPPGTVLNSTQDATTQIITQSCQAPETGGGGSTSNESHLPVGTPGGAPALGIGGF